MKTKFVRKFLDEITEVNCMWNQKAELHFIENCYKLYEQKMYQIAYGILRDKGLAEDAVQEAFFKLMKREI